jgi:hypothetical protein
MSVLQSILFVLALSQQPSRLEEALANNDLTEFRRLAELKPEDLRALE